MANNNQVPLPHVDPLQYVQEQVYLRLYMKQVWAGEGINQRGVLNPGLERNIGVMVTQDYPVYDGPDPSRDTLVARAIGQNINMGGDWYVISSIVFRPESCYPGSSLATISGSIVGGTGEFALAQGQVRHETVAGDRNGETKMLHIHVFYTPTRTPMPEAMFTEFNPGEVDDAINSQTRLLLGSGAYGSVYKANIRERTYAVKVLRVGGWQGEREYKQEIQVLGKVRHENLVTLVGACARRSALVYEFLSGGTLEKRLKDHPRERQFSWEQRIQQAAIDICNGLLFLHGTKPNPIIHGDIKPSNILFDGGNEVWKLGDFGLSRAATFFSHTAMPGHATSTPAGTVPYMDPEYLQTGVLTPQSDLYALGIILLQLVTGQDASGLRGRVADHLENLGGLVDATLNLDDRLRGMAVGMIRLGLWCSKPSRKERPYSVIIVRREIQSILSGVSSRQGHHQAVPQSRSRWDWMRMWGGGN
ncbi:hypothetical protein BS78_08G142600 [Paspalum vaginatum]|nr:hypothetical protein BS78_08G142600 [Paspalum vaginatum]